MTQKTANDNISPNQDSGLNEKILDKLKKIQARFNEISQELEKPERVEKVKKDFANRKRKELEKKKYHPILGKLEENTIEETNVVSTERNNNYWVFLSPFFSLLNDSTNFGC